MDVYLFTFIKTLSLLLQHSLECLIKCPMITKIWNERSWRYRSEYLGSLNSYDLYATYELNILSENKYT